MPTTLTDLRVPSITILDSEAAPEATMVAFLVASIAGRDGVLTPHEFVKGLGVADAIAELSDDPSVLRSLILRAFNLPPKPLDVILRELNAAHTTIPEQARRPLLEALFPLLATQGEQARPLTRRIAVALHIVNIEAILNASGLPAELSNMTALLRRAGGALGRGTEKIDLATEVAKFTGDEALLRLLHGDRRERDAQLDGVLAATLEQLRRSLVTLADADEQYENQLAVAHSLERTADDLERQCKARLRAIAKRIEVLRKHVAEDIERLSEIGGDEAEVDLRRMSEKRGILLRRDDQDVRERMIAKTLARHHDDLKRRYDEQIQLLRDELTEYQNDFVEAARSVITPISLAEWRFLVPEATASARVKDALDRGASRTLAGGAVAAAGAAGAVGLGWVAPAAIAGAVVAPVGAAVLGVVAVAGMWKIYANREERLRSEQRSRAEAIRQVARSKVGQAFAEVANAIDDIADGFHHASLSQIAPLRHDAERIREMCTLQKALTRRISADVQHRLGQWQKDVRLVDA